MQLTDADLHHLRAAQGWLELGALADSFAELDNIEPRHRAQPEVLKIRWSVCQTAKKWTEATEVAEELTRVVPAEFDGYWMRSFALHEMGRTQEAYDKLVSARGGFSGEYLLHYNLGCYLVRLGRLDEARGSLKVAFVLNPNMREQALEDPDLEPLRTELERPT